MPKTRKSLLPRNLASYDVYIEDRSENSPYFQITNLPSVFSGGRNSFLLGGSFLLQDRSQILIEILDADGNPIYQSPIKGFTESNSKLITVEIYEDTPTGFATIIIMGKATVTADGRPIPPEWLNKYNVRWVKTILTDSDIHNTSPLRFLNPPELILEENRFNSVYNPSYEVLEDTASILLTPILGHGFQSGYGLLTTQSMVFSSAYVGGTLTGSIIIGTETASVSIPIAKILNDTTAVSDGNFIKLTNGIITDIFLQSGSYETIVNHTLQSITSSVKLQYPLITTPTASTPTSFANLRLVNLSTVSGEIYKVRIQSRAITDTGTYRLVGDVHISSSGNTELLTSESIRGNLPIGNLIETPLIDENWYAGGLVANTSIQSSIYPLSGSALYYTPGTSLYTSSINDDVLFRSIRVDVPVDGTKFAGAVSESGYFLGTKRSTVLFPTTEYTLQFDAHYKNSSGSTNLSGNASRVDIYITGEGIIDNNPLGQRIGRIEPISTAQRFESKQFNFIPATRGGSEMYLRFVVTNGFWYFSNISLKPASEHQFSPDEVTLLIPNDEYHNQVMQYKVEFFDINSNSADVSAISSPTFFTGSVIDLGTFYD